MDKSFIDDLFKDKGVKFINNKIELWFNFDSKLDDDYRAFYAGAITSILINNREFLDPVNAELPFMYMFHDREKRCMQIDKIQLFSDKDQLNLPISLFSSFYEYVKHYRTKNMINVVVVSNPIYSNNRIYRLKRTISLMDHYPCIVEEVTLINDDGHDDPPPAFSLSYYSHIHSKFSPLKMCVHNKWRNCFSMSYEECLSRNTYLFSSSTPIEEYPKEEVSLFRWKLSKTIKVKNFHLFLKRNFLECFMSCDDDDAYISNIFSSDLEEVI